jgi:membrane-associated phospholipid phosphatase
MADEQSRKKTSWETRVRLADYYKSMPATSHAANGDEERFANKINTFSKTLRHNGIGEVLPESYESLRRATDSGDPKEYDKILMGGSVRLKNPQASHSFQMEGVDASQLSMPPAPRFDSAEQAGEMVELHWMSIARDIPFLSYRTDPTIARAAAELSRLSDFRGPKMGGQVTADTIFRGSMPGDTTGPFVSQLLLKQVAQHPLVIDQKFAVLAAGVDYATTPTDWLSLQLGQTKGEPAAMGPASYIKNLRDLASYVYTDISYMAYLNAALILYAYGDAALSWNNFYLHNKTQEAFVTFGPIDMVELAARGAKPAFHAAWYQKYQIHRRARPEVAAGRLHYHMAQRAVYPIHPEWMNSEAVAETAKKYGSFLLPQAFPSGSPPHSSYPSGHATVAGACITMLKAFFHEDFVIPDPVVASADGGTLVPYQGPPLTIGGELNKLASNIATGRNAAGIHYRTDMTEGMKLGEQVAVNLLRDVASTYTEDFAGFELTKFDGTRITVCAYC